MPQTTVDRTLAPATLYRPPDKTRAATSSNWTELAACLLSEPHTENWWACVSVVATVDPGIEGELRFVLSHGGEIATEARIVRHVGPVLLGWVQIAGWPTSGDQFMSIQGRRTVGSAGGVTLLDAVPSLMTLPPSAQRVGPNYPSDYDPGTEAPYPAHFDTANPYGG